MTSKKPTSGYKLVTLNPKILKFIIPEEWDFVKFNKLTLKITDGTHFTPKYLSEGIPFLRVTDIHTKTIEWKSVNKISSVEHMELIKRCNPEKGDILFSKNGTIGITTIVDWDQEFSIFVSLCLIKPLNEKIETKYLYWVLLSRIIKIQIELRSKQLSVQNLHLEEIRDFDIPLPPLNEQQKIASILSNVDASIEATQLIIEKTEKLKKGLMQKLLTRGIGHTRFKKVKWYFGKMIEIPEEWNILKFKNISKINSEKINEEYPHQNIIYVDIGSIDKFQITDYDIFALDDRPSRAQRIIQKNDVIVSTVRPYLKAFSKINDNKPNMICSTGFAVIRTKNREDGELIFQFVQTKLFEIYMIRQMEGLAYPAVTSNTIANSSILYPTERNEREKIASILSGIDTYIQKNQEYKKKLEKLKKGLMQNLLTGKIRVKT